MAQNDLIPGLETDIEIPAFCSELGEGKLYSVMIWLGPYGCLSPLHFDPLDNVLMQFVGTKRVLLYPPGTQVYAGELDTQTNTSPINFDGPLDLSLYPLLKDLPPALECTITPGDFVFIPKRWWHQVVTVETSASVNVWWR
jgi:ribosomal protein L16 Arg81 hydroxylase